MGLREYRRKRSFEKTPEPAGAKTAKSKGGHSYLIQKHAASRLHYDFRLEMEGVLKSWAVPKGPSLNPADKRLAVHVEDHPVEYGKFEGIIPKGQYGGGTVMLWDRGQWFPIGDASQSYRAGRLKFRLEGEKLRGVWNLVRMHGKAAGERQENWLLFKEKDEESRGPKEKSIVDAKPLSVASGRDLDEIASRTNKTWNSNAKPKPKSEPKLKSASRAQLPPFIAPELATLVEEAPRGSDWIYEVKFDGYRVLCQADGKTVRLLTREGNDWTAKFAPIAEDLAKRELSGALIDGEMVVLAENGTSDFQALQNALKEGHAEELVYFAFDLLSLDGEDLRLQPIEKRKEALRRLLPKKSDTIRLSDHVIGQGESFYEKACELTLEGVIAKRRGSAYRSGRGTDWLKIKCLSQQEFVVVGYTDPEGARQGLGSLLLGTRNGGGALLYSGRVGTGFTAASLRELRGKLRKLEREESPIEETLKGAEVRGVHWVEPKLVAEVKFAQWTRDGRLRHPSFHGLREDKSAGKIVREEPKDAPMKNLISGIKLSHPEKILYPGQGITKAELARYYERVAEAMLAHVGNRPLTLLRCPEGSGEPCFYQKHSGFALHRAIRTIPIKEKAGKNQYLVVDSPAGLVALAQMGVLEVHVWGCKEDRIENPDLVIFDLDPAPGVPWKRTVEGALRLKEKLEEFELTSFLKATGGKGLHVVVPIQRNRSWDEVKGFSKAIAETLVHEEPERYIATASKAKRTGKIFIDYLRNGRGATAIAPYSTRAREGAPIAAPLLWKELARLRKPASFTIRNFESRLAKPILAWEGFFKIRQSLPRIQTPLVSV